MNVYALGASKNIGYFATVRLLAKGATVTYLLRKPEVFDEDETIRSYVKAGKARLVKGDALSIDDVARGWAEAQAASESGHVDAVLFTVGGALHHFSVISGAHIFPEDICSVALLNVMRTIPANQRAAPAQPKIIALSTMGSTKASHRRLPFVMKIFYSWLLTPPHVDKFCMERVAAYCAGWPFPDETYHADLLPKGWKTLEGMPAEGSFKSIAILRPAWLTDGPAKADEVEVENKGKRPYRVVVGDKDSLGYSISRKDVGHFIAEEAFEKWGNWEGKFTALFY